MQLVFGEQRTKSVQLSVHMPFQIIIQPSSILSTFCIVASLKCSLSLLIHLVSVIALSTIKLQLIIKSTALQCQSCRYLCLQTNIFCTILWFLLKPGARIDPRLCYIIFFMSPVCQKYFFYFFGSWAIWVRQRSDYITRVLSYQAAV